MSTWQVTRVDAAGRAIGAPVTLHPTGFEARTGGVGGWESLDRPRRDPAAAWVGGTPETLELPALVTGIDRLGPGVDWPVDSTCQEIEAWGVKDPRLGEPPLLRVAGVTGVATTSRWVLQDIAWGEYIVGDRGYRVQQELTVALLRWREPTLAKGPAKKARRRKKNKAGGKGGGKGKGKK